MRGTLDHCHDTNLVPRMQVAGVHQVYQTKQLEKLYKEYGARMQSPHRSYG